MTKNTFMIDDRSIAKPPYSGPKKDVLKDKTISDEQLEAMLAKIFPIQKTQEPELEESVALALQNWHDGLIDADDLVAFLVPTRLETIRVLEGKSIALGNGAVLENVRVVGVEEKKENEDETGQGT